MSSGYSLKNLVRKSPFPCEEGITLLGACSHHLSGVLPGWGYCLCSLLPFTHSHTHTHTHTSVWPVHSEISQGADAAENCLRLRKCHVGRCGEELGNCPEPPHRASPSWLCRRRVCGHWEWGWGWASSPMSCSCAGQVNDIKVNEPLMSPGHWPIPQEQRAHRCSASAWGNKRLGWRARRAVACSLLKWDDVALCGQAPGAFWSGKMFLCMGECLKPEIVWWHCVLWLSHLWHVLWQGWARSWGCWDMALCDNQAPCSLGAETCCESLLAQLLGLCSAVSVHSRSDACQVPNVTVPLIWHINH